MRAAIYARVSTADQDCAMQLTALRDYAASRAWTAVEYVETASGKGGAKRPVLEQLMKDAQLHKFDVVLVWKLDRFGRSLQEFIGRVATLASNGVRFIAPSQGIDTDLTNPAGKLMMHILMAFAEFERELIKERVKAGVAEAQRRGTHCGRPKSIFPRGRAVEMRASGVSWRAIAKALGVPAATVRLHCLGL